MVAPMMTLCIMNMTLLALPMAVMSMVPRRWATQNWLTLTLSC